MWMDFFDQKIISIELQFEDKNWFSSGFSYLAFVPSWMCSLKFFLLPQNIYGVLYYGIQIDSSQIVQNI